GPVADTKAGMELVFVGQAAPCGERLKGTISLIESKGAPVDGLVAPRAEGGCSIRFEMPFSALGPQALAEAKLPGVGWTLTGELSTKGKARRVSWAGSFPREAVRLTEPMKETLGRFVAVKETQIGSLGVATSTVNIDVELKNPLAFDLSFVGATYQLTVGGTPLAEGRKEKFVLHAGRPNRLVLPVELSNEGVVWGLLQAATGERLEGVLSGTVRLRVPDGELDFPFELPVTLSRE
ncbi:MAG: LEA type 2 family protein, partial [Acidithiobacillales bacterium]